MRLRELMGFIRRNGLLSMVGPRNSAEILLTKYPSCHKQVGADFLPMQRRSRPLLSSGIIRTDTWSRFGTSPASNADVRSQVDTRSPQSLLSESIAAFMQRAGSIGDDDVIRSFFRTQVSPF